ncbi:MAG: aromatic ring-hydroxylating dioxygenase subunit alpha [Novosphingobium sp.]
MGQDQAMQDVLHAVRDPRLIPAKRYYDPAFFELEKAKLWPRAWQMACRLEVIPEVGDFVEYTIFEKSVLIVRTKAGIRVYHNVCRHRGMKLAEGAGNYKAGGLVCPFHGWRYDLEGRKTFVFARNIFDEEIIDPVEIALKPCRVETWGGCAFINFDDDAPSLRDHLGPVADKLDARNADKLRTEWWYASVVPTNWKVSVEAFVEQYHIMRTHPELHQSTPSVLAARDPAGLYQGHQRPVALERGRRLVAKHLEVGTGPGPTGDGSDSRTLTTFSSSSIIMSLPLVLPAARNFPSR